MRVRQLRDAVSTPTIPRPRPAESAPVPFRGGRPRTEYWDVAGASWRSRGPLPHPGP